ncbi:MAG: hypothetical protein LBR36_06650 [Bacteroidales bacterium]|jgi:hypothetical protein|nr:hypothetical protein [Bacteroidales bacterium]
MRTKSSCLFVLFGILFVGCINNNFDIKLYNYIQSNCNFVEKDTCLIDLRKIFQREYDTLYIFDGYEFAASVPLIAEDKQPSDIAHNGLLYSDEIDKVVLVKNHKIIYETKWQHQFFFICKENRIEKKGIFDGDSIIVSANFYSTPLFKVVKKHNVKERKIYILEELNE